VTTQATTSRATDDRDLELLQKLAVARKALIQQIGRKIVGHQDVVENLVAAILAGGHVMVVGVPGLAKTLLIQTVSEALDLEFSRVQFTPDLMPSDITGTELLEEDHATGKRVFKFVKGPIFGNIVLADEINRAPPKTQAALLQAMQEKNVTVAGQTYKLPAPFFVLATQNPIEQEATYPLPEAQLDRFMFNIVIDYLSEVDEMQVVNQTTSVQNVKFEKTISGPEIIEFQRLIRKMPIAESLTRYAVQLARASRPSMPNPPEFITKYVNYGASLRASQFLVLGGKARALMNGRYNVSVEDIQSVAYPVFRHRILTNFHAESEGVTTEHIIKQLIEAVPAPKSGIKE
jgi:MoxR-like ATPase